MIKAKIGNVYINRAYLNNQGYDKSGKYWGIGLPLYIAFTENYEFHTEIRAKDAQDAKNKIIDMLIK